MSAHRMKNRFRGFLPVVVDIETGGVNSATDALLQIAAVILHMDEDGSVYRGETHTTHIEPFPGANLDPKSLEFNGIDPDHPLRMAIPEDEALRLVFQPVREAIRQAECNRAVLVGHNAWFDLGFSERGGESLRDQAQSIPPVLLLRHRHALRACLRPDGAGARCRCCRT